MKIHFDIDATPQELRTFFGLPNIESLQNEMLDTFRKNMAAGVEGFDPATLMKPFFPDAIFNDVAKNLVASHVGANSL